MKNNINIDGEKKNKRGQKRSTVTSVGIHVAKTRLQRHIRERLSKKDQNKEEIAP